MSETTDRARLEAAVGKIGRAYEALLKVIDKSTDLKSEDVTKTFAFLATVQGASASKAQISLTTAIAANGGFSLDKDYGPPPAIVSTARPAVERVVGVAPRPVVPIDDDGVGFIDD